MFLHLFIFMFSLKNFVILRTKVRRAHAAAFLGVVAGLCQEMKRKANFCLALEVEQKTKLTKKFN